MGLFENSDKVIKKPTTIHPTIIKTEFVAKEILELAKRHNVSPSALDFKISFHMAVNGADSRVQQIITEILLFFPIMIMFTDTNVYYSVYRVQEAVSVPAGTFNNCTAYAVKTNPQFRMVVCPHVGWVSFDQGTRQMRLSKYVLIP